MAGEEEEIFESGFEEPSDSRPQSDRPPSPNTESQALSHAIEQIAKQGGRPTYAQPREAPQPPAQQPQQQPTEQQARVNDGQGNMVPLATLLEERERRQALAQQLQRYQEQEKASQTPKTPINQRLFEEPEAVLKELREEILQQAVQPLQQQVAQMHIQHDMSLASVRHQDVWGDAWKSWYERVGTGQDPVTYFRVMNAPSPGEELVSWFREQKFRSEVGDDPAAYREKLRQELIAEMQGGEGEKPNGQFTAPKQQVRLPTATGRMGTSPRRGNDADEDGSEEAIFEAARRR
jgi:hypothetical protein